MDRRLNRHYSFWEEKFEGEGAYIAITAPDETALSKFSKLEVPKNLEQRWFDIDYRLKASEYRLNTTYFAGDAVPTAYVDFGPGVLAAFLGSEYRLAEETVWFDKKPLILDLNNIPDLKLQTDSEIYKVFKDATRRFCEASEGKYIPSITDIGVNLDVLASLRGMENLLKDLIYERDKIKDLLVKVDGLWAAVFDEDVNIIGQYTKAFTSWIPIVSKKTWYPLLSEFSAMISPKMFQDIVFPSLQREADHLHKALFNLDGDDQIKLLPTLLQLKGLHSVEWDPVPKYDAKHNKVIKDFTSESSIDVYRRLQVAGKKIVINGIIPEQVEPILNNISADGVFFIVNCSSRKTADEFLAYSNRWVK
jgi:5-methyltetrahydrofolate--homocysteine methyltransferase